MNKVNILIVDDHTLFRTGVRRMLEAEEDMRVVGEAATGVEALEQARALMPDVILMDMQMPEMDGYVATERLRDSGYQGPIVALTAHTMKGDKEKALAAGCTGYIAKPIDTRKFLETVSQYLKDDDL